MSNGVPMFDVAVIGGGPCGATAASDLAREGWRVALLDKAGRIKPCGGAIPPRLIRDFEIPEHLLVAKVNCAQIIAPSARTVDMPIDGNGYVAMVDREHFDEWLRERAHADGAERISGKYQRLERDGGAGVIVHYTAGAGEDGGGKPAMLRTRYVIGADGALSAVARQELRGAERMPYVFAYHEIVRSPLAANANAPAQSQIRFESKRCDIYYDARVSPDFYAWVFPHGETMSIGTGSANKGFSLRRAVGELRRTTGLDAFETVRKEGAPIPLKPLKRWDNGRDVLVAGDAAGVVAPASGEGIYYAMASGRMAGEAVARALSTNDARALATARKTFMKSHRLVFFVLGIMQHFWYRSDARRERFVTMCADKDVQKLTWQSYMNKELVRRKPVAHVKIFFKDLAHLVGLVPP
jgi:geranylgeranyl reductase